MASCEDFLWTIAGEVEPTPARKEAARRSHRYLREILKSGNFADRLVADFLSGSYARDTAIAPLDDVDIVFVVDPERWKKPLFSSLPDPAGILESFARAIRYRYNSSSVVAQRRSVRLELYHLDIDVVPAVATDRQGFLKIPDVDEDTWILTAPEKHAEIATSVNKRCRGRFKPLVKLMKYWNSNLPTTANLKSFAIETMAIRIFSDVQLSSLEDGMLAFFDIIASQGGKGRVNWRTNFGIKLGYWGSHVHDVAGTGSNVVAKVDSTRRIRFIEHAVRGRERLLEGNEARSEETAARRAAEALKM